MAAVFSRSSSFLPGFMRQPLAFRFFSTSSSSILNLRVTQLEDSPYVDSRIVDLMYDQSVTFLETLEQKARQELATLRRQLEDIHLTREVRQALTEQERKVAFMILTEYHAESAYSFHVKKGKN